ncbi:MAG: hypothetical protein CMM01_04225 [Rhodopirellula sp.]|nr:hypothetical protein [Rhodopirellula sp.]
MKRILFIFACLVSAPCIAADFEEFGMSSMQPLTNAEASEVRGAGVDTFVSSLATQSFNFALADRDSGSVFNMNSNAQMRAYDGAQLYEGSSGATQAVGASSQGGIQFGDATFTMGEFTFDLSGFTSVGQANLIAGPSSPLNFSGLLNNAN